MFSGSVLQNVLRGGECSLVLSCGTFGEEGNVHWSCPVERFVRKGMFSGSVLWNVL